METEGKKLSRRHMLQVMGASVAGIAVAACAAPPVPTQPPAATEALAATQPPAPTEAPAATEAPPAATAAPAAAKVKIQWYANADPTRNKWMTDVAIPEFAAAQPDITVEPVIVPWNDFDPKLSSMFAANSAPDVFANWGSTGYGEYWCRKMCIAIDEYLKADASFLNLEDFPKSAIDGVTVRGNIVGLPLYILGTYTYYNKDLFAQAGLPNPPSNWDDKTWTWDKMVEVSQKLTKNYDDPATGQYGVMTSLAFEDQPWLWGAELWPSDAVVTATPKTINIEDPKVVQSFQNVADLVCKHKVAPDAAISQAISAAGDPFQAGKAVMNMSGGWGFWTLKEVAGSFNWGAAALPWGDPAANRKDALYADPMLISTQTKNRDQAWQLVRYIDSEDGLRKFVVATWSPPSRKSLLPDWLALWPEGLRKELDESLQGSWKYGDVTPWNRISGYSQFYDAFNTELLAVQHCEKTMEEAVPVIKKAVEDVLATLTCEA